MGKENADKPMTSHKNKIRGEGQTEFNDSVFAAKVIPLYSNFIHKNGDFR